MSPSIQTGETAISNQNGDHHRKPFSLNSIEREVNKDNNPDFKSRIIQSVLLAYSGENMNALDLESPLRLDVFQRGLKKLLNEHDFYLKAFPNDLTGIEVRKQYVFEVINYYFSNVFFSIHPPNPTELDFTLLNECIDRYSRDETILSYTSICKYLKFDDADKTANFLRLTFSSRANEIVSEHAIKLIGVISDKCRDSKTKTDFVKRITIGMHSLLRHKGMTNSLQEEIVKWLKSKQ